MRTQRGTSDAADKPRPGAAGAGGSSGSPAESNAGCTVSCSSTSGTRQHTQVTGDRGALCTRVSPARGGGRAGAPLSRCMQSPDLFRLEQFVGGCNFNYLRAEEPIRGCARRGFYEFP